MTEIENRFSSRTKFDFLMGLSLNSKNSVFLLCFSQPPLMLSVSTNPAWGVSSSPKRCYEHFACLVPIVCHFDMHCYICQYCYRMYYAIYIRTIQENYSQTNSENLLKIYNFYLHGANSYFSLPRAL